MQTLRFGAFGFQVDVQPAFLLLAGVFMLFELQAQQPLVAVVSLPFVIFVSILLHELGHAFTARWFGLKVGPIVLHGIGGQVSHAPTTPGKQLLISVAGPLAGLSLAAAAMVASLLIPGVDPSVPIVEQVILLNVFWSLFNLLPLYPLDGGNALRSGLALMIRERLAWQITAGIGVVVGGGLALFGFQSGMFFLAVVCGMAAYTNVQVLQSARVR